MSESDSHIEEDGQPGLGSTCMEWVQPGVTAPGLHRYLCFFLTRHLEFRIPEIEALAHAAVCEKRLHLQSPSGICTRALLPPRGRLAGNSSRRQAPSLSINLTLLSSPPLVADGHRSAEAAPVVRWELPYGGQQASPFWYVHLPSDDIVRQVARDALLTKVHGVAHRMGQCSAVQRLGLQCGGPAFSPLLQRRGPLLCTLALGMGGSTTRPLHLC